MEETDFKWGQFWVQAHGLPFNKLTKKNGEIIVDTTKPLPRGFWLKRPSEGNDIWISYKFEKLSNFCYACGRLGHDRNGCKFVSKEVGEQSGYGPDLRTGLVRPTGLPVEHYRQQVDEAENRLQGLLHRRPPPCEPHPIVPPTRDPSTVVVLNQSASGSHTPPACSDKDITPRPSETSVAIGSYGHITRGKPPLHPAPHLGVAQYPLQPTKYSDQTFSSTIGPVVTFTCISPPPSHTHTEIAPALSQTRPTYFVTEPPDSPKGGLSHAANELSSGLLLADTLGPSTTPPVAYPT
ncbi:hypothetical protein ACSBR2_026172 [Camellia fascicularis]